MRKVRSYLETLDVHTGQRTVLAAFDRRIEAPNWTREGKLIYNSEGKLYAFDLETGVSEEIPSGFANRCNNDHVLSPDHTEIAVSHHTAEDGKSRVYVFPLAGGEPVLVTEEGPSYLHGWSPDGSTLAYCAERNGQYDIYTIPVSGGREKQLTDSPGLNDGPEYSPDGRLIWFNSVRSGLMQIWRMKSDGSEQTQMTFDESNSWFPHVSPDGNTVVYIAYRKGDVDPGDHPRNKHVELRAMSSEGGPYRVLAELFGGQGTINVNSWSPDSTHFAFVSYELVDE
ncbi:PD40 domain-containing protein [Paenibacillus sp. PAMC21692]|uniref:TolB family protein n=1 Tax=Paenibacillus sp. PAMC21692 TaxID=2762320 RepID=UPI00164DFBD8|nr:PD40 domain-containing protein [Paenibacillus sp. PAMC21692]QNK57750.1 TolB family protein [Paenibacillus sp. PAMC21692]